MLDEGFEPLGIYANVAFASQEQTHTTPPLKRIIEERHLAFRVLPAYLVYDDAPEEYKNRHIIYIRKGTVSKLDLLRGCETNLDDVLGI